MDVDKGSLTRHSLQFLVIPARGSWPTTFVMPVVFWAGGKRARSLRFTPLICETPIQAVADPLDPRQQPRRYIQRNHLGMTGYGVPLAEKSRSTFGQAQPQSVIPAEAGIQGPTGKADVE